MESIAKECQNLKEEYDACFNLWFCEHFLKGKANESMCEPLFKVYQDCIKKAMKQRNIVIKDAETARADFLEKDRSFWTFF